MDGQRVKKGFKQGQWGRSSRRGASRRRRGEQQQLTARRRLDSVSTLGDDASPLRQAIDSSAGGKRVVGRSHPRYVPPRRRLPLRCARQAVQSRAEHAAQLQLGRAPTGSRTPHHHSHTPLLVPRRLCPARRCPPRAGLPRHSLLLLLVFSSLSLPRCRLRFGSWSDQSAS